MICPYGHATFKRSLSLGGFFALLGPVRRKLHGPMSSSFLLLLVRPGAPSSFLLLVVRQLVSNSFLLLVVRHLLLVAMHFLLVASCY